MFIMTADCYNQNQEKSTMTFIYWNLQNLNNVIINKTKVLLSQAKLSYLAFQFFDFEHIWWRLFWAYLMKVILSIPDEGYFEHTWWRLFWAYLMKVILSITDEGYFERTWWRLFLAYLMKVILSVPDEDYFERTWWRLFWAYLMKVILSVNDDGYFEWTWWRLFQKRIVCTTFDILHMFFLF